MSAEFLAEQTCRQSFTLVSDWMVPVRFATNILKHFEGWLSQKRTSRESVKKNIGIVSPRYFLTTTDVSAPKCAAISSSLATDMAFIGVTLVRDMRNDT